MAKKKAETTKGVPLSTIAKELKMDPKNARARLRRLNIPKSATVGDAWVFTASGVKWAKAALKS